MLPFLWAQRFVVTMPLVRVSGVAIATTAGVHSVEAWPRATWMSLRGDLYLWLPARVIHSQ